MNRDPYSGEQLRFERTCRDLYAHKPPPVKEWVAFMVLLCAIAAAVML